jgi:hypothetical protein
VQKRRLAVKRGVIDGIHMQKISFSQQPAQFLIAGSLWKYMHGQFIREFVPERSACVAEDKFMFMLALRQQTGQGSE